MLISPFIELAQLGCMSTIDDVAPDPAADMAFLPFAQGSREADADGSCAADVPFPLGVLLCPSFAAALQDIAPSQAPLPTAPRGNTKSTTCPPEGKPGSHSVSDATPPSTRVLLDPLENGAVRPRPETALFAAETMPPLGQDGFAARSERPARPVPDAARAATFADIRSHDESVALAVSLPERATEREGARRSGHGDRAETGQASTTPQTEAERETGGPPAVVASKPETRALPSALRPPRPLEYRNGGAVQVRPRQEPNGADAVAVEPSDRSAQIVAVADGGPATADPPVQHSPADAGRLVSADIGNAAHRHERDTTVPAHPAAEMPHRIGRQIASAIQTFADRPIEISLSPEELGRVRMVITATEGTLTLSVTADRTETLDLMRRHADQLAREFGELGFSDLRFSFAGQNGAGRQGGHALSDLPMADDHPTDAGAHPVQSPLSSPLAAPSERGLDIRI